MQILIFLLFGLVVGAVARFLVPGKEPGGWLASMVIGTTGAFIGGFFGEVVGISREGDPATFGMSLLGATALVAIYHALARRRSLRSA